MHLSLELADTRAAAARCREIVSHSHDAGTTPGQLSATGAGDAPVRECQHAKIAIRCAGIASVVAQAARLLVQNPVTDMACDCCIYVLYCMCLHLQTRHASSAQLPVLTRSQCVDPSS